MQQSGYCREHKIHHRQGGSLLCFVFAEDFGLGATFKLLTQILPLGRGSVVERNGKIPLTATDQIQASEFASDRTTENISIFGVPGLELDAVVRPTCWPVSAA